VIDAVYLVKPLFNTYKNVFLHRVPCFCYSVSVGKSATASQTEGQCEVWRFELEATTPLPFVTIQIGFIAEFTNL
jgi:hypothetical protein